MLLVLFADAPALGGSFDQRMFPAFPGAEGAGAYATGGRGGKVLLVTSLADYDPRRERPIAGTLRAAITTAGPRLILFRVAGNIALKADLDVTDPHLTIAAQSAPGEGVCLQGASLVIRAPDVVIRYLRVRPGDIQRRELDCISSSAHNVILDHCSASWGIDETISTNADSAEVTVQWCLIVESLNHSVHHKGSHGYGSLISGPGEISYHHNVYAFHRSRSPRGGDVRLDFRNNLLYGWGDRAGYSGDERLELNYVNNYLRPLAYSKLKDIAFSPGGMSQRLFFDGNYFFGYPAGTADNWLLVKPPNLSTPEAARRALRADRAFPTCTVTTDTAEAAYEKILREGGAVLPVRDAIDTRLFEQIRQGTGRLIDSQTEVGGWLPLAGAAPAADIDLDGMSDLWEAKFGLDPQTVTPSSQDTDGDGYPDLEEFLNGTNPRVAETWIDPPAIVSSGGDAFVEPSTITLSAAPKATIHYTLDDSEPNKSSERYASPFQLDRSATLRAKALVEHRASHVRNAQLACLRLHDPLATSSHQTGLAYRYFEKLDDATLDVVPSAKPSKSGVVDGFRVDAADGPEDFGFHFTGLVKVPADGVYTFYLRCSPRGRLSVAGEPVVESQGHKREQFGKIALGKGLHPIALTIYYRTEANPTLEVDIAGPNGARHRLGADDLFHAAE